MFQKHLRLIWIQTLNESVFCKERFILTLNVSQKHCFHIVVHKQRDWEIIVYHTITVLVTWNKKHRYASLAHHTYNTKQKPMFKIVKNYQIFGWAFNGSMQNGVAVRDNPSVWLLASKCMTVVHKSKATAIKMALFSKWSASKHCFLLFVLWVCWARFWKCAFYSMKSWYDHDLLVTDGVTCTWI